jgi:hypothetical protein
MDKLEIALKLIANCDLCNGKGYSYWGSSDDEYEIESCECNIYDIILDDDGDVIWDNGLLSEPELFATMEAN